MEDAEDEENNTNPLKQPPFPSVQKSRILYIVYSEYNMYLHTYFIWIRV